MTLEAFILGCGGSMPLPNRHLTSVLLRREGEVFLFDCGEGTQVSLRRLNLKWKKISAILISHTHADHVTGLPGMLMLSSQVERDEPLVIIGPPRIADYIESSRRTLEMYINFDIQVREIANPDRPQAVYHGADFVIHAFPLKHTRVCVGYSLVETDRPGRFDPRAATDLGVPRGPLWSELQSGNGVVLDDGAVVQPSAVLGPARPGRKFSFVTDTLPIADIPRHVKDSDLLIMEGMFTHDLAETARAKRHMTATDAGRLARRAGGIKRMGLIHYSPRFTRRQLDALEREARAEFAPAFLTHDRMHIDVPYADSVADA